MKEFCSVESSQRCLLCSLEDNSIAASQRWPHFPGKHDEGKVPRDDLACNPNGFVQCLHMMVSIRWYRQTVDLISPP